MKNIFYIVIPKHHPAERYVAVRVPVVVVEIETTGSYTIVVVAPTYKPWIRRIDKTFFTV